jgi:signal transduction histidine kinase
LPGAPSATEKKREMAKPTGQRATRVQRIREAGLYLIAALAVLAFSGSLFISLQGFRDTRAVLYGTRTSGSWVAFSAELEYRRFMTTLARYGLGDGETSQDELVTRFDIMWSRLPLLTVGSESERLTRTDAAPQLAQDMLARLQRLDPLVKSLEPGDRAGYRAIAGQLEEFGPRLRDLLLDVEIDLKGEFREDVIDSAYHRVFLSFAGVLVAGGLVILLLFLQLRRAARLSEARRRASAEADAANRAKSEFLARMTHELRTPLNAVIGYSELLYEEAEERGQHDMLEDLERIKIAGNHLLAMINDTLDLAKIETGRAEPSLDAVDVRPLALEVLDTVRPLMWRNRNRLEHDLGEVGRIVTDATKLRQILFNLLSNAAKFTQDGVVRLELERQPGTPDDSVVLRVRDSGVGIARKNLERIFQPFIQADGSSTRVHDGTGLGLTLARSFCELLGGTLEAESWLGEGSVFTARLPAERSTGTRQPEVWAPVEEPVG